MGERIAVETLTLKEISDLFKRSLETAHPRAKRAIDIKMKKLEKAKVSNHKWVQSYEIFKGAKLNFYCQRVYKQAGPIVSIGMTHRTINGLILLALDVSNGGIANGFVRPAHWDRWVNIYTAHFCERYAERIMKAEEATFKIGSEGVMFSDVVGVARVTDILSDEVQEIELQFQEGQFYGYRDSKSKIIYFKTVYSNDMLKGDRVAFRDEWKDTIDNVQELFKIGS